MSSTELERLLFEIGEQPTVIARVLAGQRPAVERVAGVIRRKDPSAVVFVARGSSDNAAVYGRYLLEVCNRRLTSLAAPSGLTLYGTGPRLEDTLVIGISQSGRGEDVVAYLQAARSQGALTLAVVNDESSPLAGSAEHMLACMAGPELSIPATKTVTAQMMLLAMLSVALDSAHDEPLTELADAVQQALQQRDAAGRLARALAATRVGSVIGRGFAFPVALELALKLKETSYTRAEPFSAADFLHGPVALVEPSYAAIIVDVGGQSGRAALELVHAIRERGGQPALLRAGRLDWSIDFAGPQVAVDTPVREPFAPIVALALGQLVAVELALALGLDPARPRGLRKVTSTR